MSMLLQDGCPVSGILSWAIVIRTANSVSLILVEVPIQKTAPKSVNLILVSIYITITLTLMSHVTRYRGRSR